MITMPSEVQALYNNYRKTNKLGNNPVTIKRFFIHMFKECDDWHIGEFAVNDYFQLLDREKVWEWLDYEITLAKVGGVW